MQNDLSKIKFHRLPLKDIRRCLSEYQNTNSSIKSNNDSNTVQILESLPARTKHIPEPWRDNAYYFQHCLLSRLASSKMLTHSVGADNKEVMGMLIGYISNDCIIVKDCYSLPVEGTETRVNAQLESYEYMVQYMDAFVGCEDRIVGWYHSHPGYGCWLSNIDIETQSLNQNYQDPYLAIVIDPKKSCENKALEIGAFRTLNADESRQYYPLTIQLYQLSADSNVAKMKFKFDIDDFDYDRTQEKDLFVELTDCAENWHHAKKAGDNDIKLHTIESKQRSGSFSENEEDTEDRCYSISSTSSLTTRHTTDMEMDERGSVESSVDVDVNTVTDTPLHVTESKQEYLVRKNQLLVLKLREYARLRSYRQLFTQDQGAQ